MKNHHWTRGDKKRLAKHLKITPSYLSDILYGHHADAPILKYARQIERWTNERLKRLDILYPKESKNPLLKK